MRSLKVASEVVDLEPLRLVFGEPCGLLLALALRRELREGQRGTSPEPNGRVRLLAWE